MNYFVEGIQGAGKSTMAEQLAMQCPGCRVYPEGAYSPVELAWCAYVTPEEYKEILDHYPTLSGEIQKNTVVEGNRLVVMYTLIQPAPSSFYEEMETHEIYNGRLSPEAFCDLVLRRFAVWQGDNAIFECSIFQNIIENLMLFYCWTDGEIRNFYHRVKAALGDKPYEIVYLQVSDIRAAEEHVRAERRNPQGEEVWFQAMLRYLEQSPYGKANGLQGMDGLVSHLERRVKLETQLLQEVFPAHARIIARTI